MKTLKLTIALFVLVLFSTSVNAQNFGLTASRGISTVCPDYKSFSSTISQGYSIGAYKYHKLKKNYNLKTGFNLTTLQSCRTITNAEGIATMIPNKYIYAHMPISIEKEFFSYNKMSRSANHYTWTTGIELAYLMHENGFEQNVASDFKTSPLNIGASTAFQLVKPMTYHAAFAIGPQFQAFSTGQEITTIAFFAGIKLDWKFGKY